MNSKHASGSRTRVSSRTIILASIALYALTLATSAIAQTGVSFSKTFSPDAIGPGSVSTLTFEIGSENPGPVSDLAFADTLPAALAIAGPAFVTNTCGGTVTAPEGGATITFSGGSVGAGDSCRITVDVTGTTPGTHMNVSGDLTSSAGNSGAATADLMVVTNRPGFTKNFSPAMVQFGADSTLTFTIDNSANASLESGLAFTDELPPGLQVASPPNASNGCNGTLTATAGSNTVSYFGGFLTAGVACTITMDVETTAVGRLDNRTSDLTSSAGNSGKASDSIEVAIDELALVKDFIDDPAAPGTMTTLEFAIANLDRTETVADITFTDDLDATLSGLVAVPPLPVEPCGAGSELSGTDLLTLTGGTLPPGGNCSFQVTLQVSAGASPGNFPNITSMISGNAGGGEVLGSAASDTLIVDVFPILTKTFLDGPVGAGGTADVEFTVTNTSTSFGASDISFIDPLSTFLPGTVPQGLPVSACNGTLSQINNFPSTGDVSLSLSGASLGPGASCSFVVTLDIPPGAPSGTFTNTTDEITATVDGTTRTGPPATDTLDVVGAPRLTKSFIDDPVQPSDAVTLQFTLTHAAEAASDATGIAFTDDLEATLAGLVATDLPLTDICGTGSLLEGDPDASNLSFTGGSLSPGESCTFPVTLQVPASAELGSFTNTTSEVSATVSGVAATGPAASDDLIITEFSFAKTFIDSPVIAGDTATLRFTVENNSPSFALTDMAFTDDLDAMLSGAAAVGLPANDICGAGSSIGGTSTLVFTGGNLAAGESCTFDVTVQIPAGTPDNQFGNTTSPLSATFDGNPVTVPAASAGLEVNSNLLLLSKSFTNDPVVPGGNVTRGVHHHQHQQHRDRHRHRVYRRS